MEWRNAQNSVLDRQDRIEASLLNYPQPFQHRPNTQVNVLAAAILGLLIGGIAIFLLEYIESNVLRSTQDLERWADIPVLAAISGETRGN